MFLATSRSEMGYSVKNSVTGAVCPYFGKCGGCDYIDREYDEQLKIKQRAVEKQIGKFCRVESIIGCEQPMYYRNKVHSVFDRDKRGRIIRGIYKEDSHEVISVKGCLLEDRRADAIIETIKELLPSFKIKVYDEDSRFGLLRHVLVRTGSVGGAVQIMVILVTAEAIFPSRNNFVKALLKKHPEITTVVQNINNKRTSMILGDRNQIMYGKGYIEDELCGKIFRLSPKSFYQINQFQTKNLYGIAIELARLTGRETVLDAYCGTGTIGICMADKAEKVYGVELNRDAVKDAVVNARRNNTSNIEFFNADATEFMKRIAAERDKNKGIKIDVLCMDPPRSGSTGDFIKAAAELKIPRIVYVSCEPVTLARDLELFAKCGYNCESVIPVDMFPGCKNCEVVVSLVPVNGGKRSPKNKR